MIIDKRDDQGRDALVDDSAQQDNTAPPAYEPRQPVASGSGSTPAASGSLSPTQGAGPSNCHNRSIDNVNARILSNPFLTPPTNFVSIVEGNNSVKGSWTLDTSLSPPASLLAPLSNPRDVRPNLKIDCHNGSINANVRLVRGDDQPRALLDANTWNGSTRIAVMTRGKQRVQIRCQSHNGAIKILLPRDFTGLFYHRTHNGSALFSPAVKACMTTFSVTRGVGKCFIGNWQEADFSPPEQGRDSTEASPTEMENWRGGPVRTSSSESSHMARSRSPPNLNVIPPSDLNGDAQYGDYDYATSSVGSSSGGGSALGPSSVVSSSTILPSQSASQVGTGQNLSPRPLFQPYQSQQRMPSRPISPSTAGSGSFMSTTAVSSNSGILDEAANSWTGDLLEVDTVNGTIRVAFVDEPKDYSKSGSIAMGAARLMKNWLSDRGLDPEKLVGLGREASGWVKGV